MLILKIQVLTVGVKKKRQVHAWVIPANPELGSIEIVNIQAILKHYHRLNRLIGRGGNKRTVM